MPEAMREDRPHEAEDAVSEVVLRALRRIELVTRDLESVVIATVEVVSHLYIRHHIELFCKNFFNFSPVGVGRFLFIAFRPTVVYASYFLSIEPI